MRCITATFALLLLVGCASSRDVRPETYAGPLPQLEIPAQPHYLTDGSLYAETGAADLISDFRAAHIGDIVTVRFIEAANASTTADNKLKKDSKTKLESPVLFGWENRLKGKLGPDFDPALAFQVGTGKEFSGQGETTRKQTVTAVVAARVMAVGTGGRMLIAGSKRVTVNHEQQTITMAGIIRPEDVGADNAITSSSIADLSFYIGGNGDLGDITRQGWFHRLLSKIWPF